jgi:deferrochelatase/peroxidase EfeB
MPQPDILGRNGTYVGFRKYQSRVGAFNRFLQANGSNEGRTRTASREAGRPLAQWRAAEPWRRKSITPQSAPTHSETTTSITRTTREGGKCRSDVISGA